MNDSRPMVSRYRAPHNDEGWSCWVNCLCDRDFHLTEAAPRLCECGLLYTIKPDQAASMVYVQYLRRAKPGEGPIAYVVTITPD